MENFIENLRSYVAFLECTLIYKPVAFSVHKDVCNRLLCYVMTVKNLQRYDSITFNNFSSRYDSFKSAQLFWNLELQSLFIIFCIEVLDQAVNELGMRFIPIKFLILLCACWNRCLIWLTRKQKQPVLPHHLL